MNPLHTGLALLACLLLSACDRSSGIVHDEDTHAGTSAQDGHDHGEEEDHVRIDAGIAGEAGIRVATVGPGTIADEHVVQGLLTPVEGRTATVAARYPGVVRELKVRTGEKVRAGQALAVIESNLSLSTYEVKSPLSGTVLAVHATPGSVTGEGAVLYQIADLSTLWVDLHIFGSDAGHFFAGMPVEVIRLSDGVQTRSRIDALLPSVATASQSTIARASVANPDGLWRPGAAVQARITVDEEAAALVVPLTALQDIEGDEAVFVREGEEYQARPVRTGRRDARQVQVLSGVQAGELVVVEQSYLIKAELEKAGASHEH